jgi:hypothetical protein
VGDAPTEPSWSASGVFIDFLEAFAQDTRVQYLLPGGVPFDPVPAIFFDTAISTVWVNTEWITGTSDTTTNTIKITPLPRMSGSRSFGKLLVFQAAHYATVAGLVMI